MAVAEKGQTSNAILALNAGSSSIKYALCDAGAGPVLTLIAKGQIATDGISDHAPALETLLAWADAHLGSDVLAAIGHRVVHGGRDYQTPVRITPAVIDALERLTPLAPLHQPNSLNPIRAIAAMRPSLRQVACFDTAFHHTMPATARRLALPQRFEAEGIYRYGFHGLSYEYIARTMRRSLPHLATGRVIVAHLGNGASLCAMRDGRSIETTMSFTALDGLVMGTRCGSLDPGVVLYLLQEKGMAANDVQHLLYNESGLLGVSGISSDMRVLLASIDQNAKDAVELFVYRIARETAALTAALGGLDGFIFTAGIGEHAAEIRTMVCDRLQWLGLSNDGTGSVEVHVIPTDEEMMIAVHTMECLAQPR